MFCVNEVDIFVVFWKVYFDLSSFDLCMFVVSIVWNDVKCDCYLWKRFMILFMINNLYVFFFIK